jgi:hypothetical protein
MCSRKLAVSVIPDTDGQPQTDNQSVQLLSSVFFFGNRHWLASRSNSLTQRGEKKKANGSMGSQAKEDQIRSNKWQK